MDARVTLRPTGLQKITVPQIQAEAAGSAPFAAASPSRVLAAFKRASPALGVSRRVVDLIDLLMSHSRAQDWTGGGVGPIVWPSDVELEDRLCVGASQRKALVRAALDAGYVRMRRSATGKRWGYRKGSEAEARIVEAFGFDLSPLGGRMPEFERLSAEWEARREEGKRLRREITVSRNRTLALVEFATSENLDGEDWAATAAQANALWRERGDQRDPLPLIPISSRLRALVIWTQERVTAAVESKETDPAGPENRPRITTTTEELIGNPTKGVAFDAPLSRGRQGGVSQAGQGRGNERGTPQAATVRRTGLDSESALRGFVVTPNFILTIAPIFRSWVSNSRPGWVELYEAADFVRAEVEISRHAWGQACVSLGRQEAIAALAAICARHASGQVKSPGGLLRKMVELHGAGTLRLDCTLHGLAARLPAAQA